MWQVRSIKSPVVVNRATDALVAGLDTPGLRDLAGRASDENWFEMRDLIQKTFLELDAPLPQIDTDAPILLALQFMREQFVSGKSALASSRGGRTRMSDTRGRLRHNISSNSMTSLMKSRTSTPTAPNGLNAGGQPPTLFCK